MCTHFNSEIKFCKKNDGYRPVLYCYDCMTFVNDYLPKYDHSFFTHSPRDIGIFLNEGTELEKKEKVLSLTYGLNEILVHYKVCECGYEENYSYILGTFINEFRLLEYHFLESNHHQFDPSSVNSHIKLFPVRILEKLKFNSNHWTVAFRKKFNIHATTDYKKFEV